MRKALTTQSCRASSKVVALISLALACQLVASGIHFGVSAQGLADLPPLPSDSAPSPVPAFGGSDGDSGLTQQINFLNFQQILDTTDTAAGAEPRAETYTITDDEGIDTNSDNIQNGKNSGQDKDKDKDDEFVKPMDRPAVGPWSKIDKDILELAQSMSIQELTGQMTQIQVGKVLNEKGELDPDKVKFWVEDWGVGSFLDTPANHGGKYTSYSATQFSKIVDGIQQYAIQTGKKVPMLYGLDSVHGANYVDGSVLFPQQIGLGATFNTTLAYEAGRITAKDTRAAGIPWVFGPILDVSVHKLWPRTYETFGEDPFLVSQMGRAIIRGLQGDYKKDRTRVAACMKHFIGYAASRDGQDRSSAWIPDNYLMDYFVPSFQVAIDTGVATAMETYIDVNGQPVVGSHFYLQELLRDRMSFKGMLVTDWQEIDRLSTDHRAAATVADATRLVLERTSVDMSMVPEADTFPKDAAHWVNSAKGKEKTDQRRQRLVESVVKILQLKKDLGLFDKPFSDPALRPLVGSHQDVVVAQDAARESITVLKNENDVLPLKVGKNRILLTGPAADSITALAGGWSLRWQGADTDEWYQGRGVTLLQGLQKVFGEKNVIYRQSVDFEGLAVKSHVVNDATDGIKQSDIVRDDQQTPVASGQEPVIPPPIDVSKTPIPSPLPAYLEELVRAAKDVDTIVLALGEKPYAELLGNIQNLDLPTGQLNLIRELKKRTSCKIVVVLVEGRPRSLQDAHESADVIVNAYLPGPWAGLPIAEILAGVVNPSGRLPMSYPAGTGSAGSFYYRSGVDPYNPLYQFGSGLSYSTVEYSQVKLSATKMHLTTFEESEEEDDEEQSEDQDTEGVASSEKKSSGEKNNVNNHHITASVVIENTSGMGVKETVFWYVSQDYRTEVMPESMLLKGFEKVYLEPGESKTVSFVIDRQAVSFHDRNLRKRVEKSSFLLIVNANRPEEVSVVFEIV